MSDDQPTCFPVTNPRPSLLDMQHSGPIPEELPANIFIEAVSTFDHLPDMKGFTDQEIQTHGGHVPLKRSVRNPPPEVAE